jgi:quinol monooxygenase YgiN
VGRGDTVRIDKEDRRPRQKERAMALTVVRHTVRDYTAWRKVYDEFKPTQTAGGVLEESCYQDPANPNDVLILHRFASVAKAQAFVENPALREAMERAGVEGMPRIEIFEDA